MKMPLTLLASGLILASCTAASHSAPPRDIEAGADGTCDAGPVQTYVGAEADAGLGAIILERSEARRLRWIPPRTVVTADFRTDRVNVEYGDDMNITRIACG